MGPEGGVQPLVVSGEGARGLQRQWVPLLFQMQAVCVYGFLTPRAVLCEPLSSLSAHGPCQEEQGAPAPHCVACQVLLRPPSVMRADSQEGLVTGRRAARAAGGSVLLWAKEI